jgi:hypothetical protein
MTPIASAALGSRGVERSAWSANAGSMKTIRPPTARKEKCTPLSPDGRRLRSTE